VLTQYRCPTARGVGHRVLFRQRDVCGLLTFIECMTVIYSESRESVHQPSGITNVKPYEINRWYVPGHARETVSFSLTNSQTLLTPPSDFKGLPHLLG